MMGQRAFGHCRATVAIWVYAAIFPLSAAYAITPGNPGPGDVAFSIISGQNVKAISPFIYGMNSFFNTLPTGTYSGHAIGLNRLGGNRWTGYNW
jgi:hypothetical protein